MSLPKLLITGCNGLVGRILWDHLENDFDLYGLDISSNKSSEKIFQADISKPEQVQSAFSRIASLTFVVHLAGDPRADADWDSVFVNNIGGTKNIYEAARLAGVKRIVFASSNHVTGAYESFPPSPHTKKIQHGLQRVIQFVPMDFTASARRQAKQLRECIMKYMGSSRFACASDR